MIIQGDSLQELAKLQAESIDAVITDPPYGYSFMGKNWDKAVPSVEIWQECLRVLKPGAFCMVMSAPRSDVQMHMIQNLTEAGFRLDFTPIYWTYASGFPKAGNIGKMVDKRNGTKRKQIKRVRVDGKAPGRVITGFGNGNPKIDSVGSSELEGSYAGFQPKPAVEVIIVAMKPLSEKTFVDQALKNGKGITWLDDVRIPHSGEADQNSATPQGKVTSKTGHAYTQGDERTEFDRPDISKGRFPANLLVSDDVLNDGRVIKGELHNKPASGVFGNDMGGGIRQQSNHDSGSYSRYFDLDKWASTLPFLIVPKASKSEKNEGLGNFEKQEPNYTKTYRPTAKESGDKGQDTPYAGTNRGGQMKNGHPTVKPIRLMSYLITLFTRKGDTVLDPFVGSGTTCIAAKQLGRKYIGIEREPEYVEIAEARLKATNEPEPTLL